MSEKMCAEGLSENAVSNTFCFTDKFDIITSPDLTLKIAQKHPGDGKMLMFYYYDIINPANQIVGKISVRIGHNFHSYYNGHIGYEIFEEYRGSGYACKACRLALDVARFHNMDFIYLACAESNIASYKTIEKLGAELVEICDVPREYFAWREGMERRRIYKLEL